MNTPNDSKREQVLALCRQFNADYNHDGINTTEYAAAWQQFTREIPAALGQDIQNGWLEDILYWLDRVAALEDGTHEDLTQTTNGVIDEGGHLRDSLTQLVEDSVEQLLAWDRRVAA